MKATETAPRIKDPIAFEVAKNALISLADELAITVIRTAHSQTVRDSMDFSTAICDARGRVIAQGCGIPLHLGAIPVAMDAVLAKYGSDTHPGDVFVLNDPDEGGMHLPDAFMIKPVFRGPELIGYSAVVAHHQDIGGRAAGGNAVDSTEIFQEGLQIPVLKFLDRGKVNETLLALWLRNVRLPDLVYGDIQAQIAACHVGEVGLLQIADRYEPGELQALMDEILDYTEARVRAEIATIPRGEYSFEDHIDDDGFGSGPIKICVKIRVLEDSIEADFDCDHRPKGHDRQSEPACPACRPGPDRLSHRRRHPRRPGQSAPWTGDGRRRRGRDDDRHRRHQPQRQLIRLHRLSNQRVGCSA